MATGFSTEPMEPEPAWEVALLMPRQGHWTVQEYLDLTNSTNRFVEFDNGRIEVLEMPTQLHQMIVRYLFLAMHAFVESGKLGEVLFGPLRVYTIPDKYREPDIAIMLAGNDYKRSDDYWTGADLVVEVVSPDPKSRQRDLDTKPEEYAAAKIPEYWIVDPEREEIAVLYLEGDDYSPHGVFRKGDVASSRLLPGFSVHVDDVFAAAST